MHAIHEKHTTAGPLMAAVILTLGLAGCITGGDGLVVAATPMSVYITDAPANLSRLDVGVASVTVGDPPVSLHVQTPAFDLAALRGPDDAILLADGLVPADIRAPIEITFSSARATIDGEAVDLAVDGPLLLDGTGADEVLLVDIGLEESLDDEDGVLTFRPTAKDLLVPDASASAWRSLSAASSSGPDASAGDGPWDGVPGATGDLSAGNDTQADVPAAPVEASAAGEVVGWLATFEPASKEAEMQARSTGAGTVFVFAFQHLPVAYVLGTEAQAQRLLQAPDVLAIEREARLEFHDAESRMALRMPKLMDPVTGLRDADGDPIDGRGVGVAVVDTGIYAAHADLLHGSLWSSGNVAKNLKVESQAYIDMIHTDTTSGHGTHVAGIIGGQGTTDAHRTGIAPGATIYGLGIGEVSTTVWSAQAFDWILENHASVDPPIRVVTNSWSTGTDYDPNSVTNRFAAKMADQGMVVVFSAGNRGGDGSTNEVSGQCRIPKAGILCVAAFDDLGTGTRDGKIAGYSSRGLKSDRSTWPDLSAPGTDIFSLRPPAGTTTGVGTNVGYVELSGTSQAAPHVAAVAALMLQADPQLTPSEVASTLRSTAYPFTDGGGYTDGSHHAKGAGLVDAYAAVAAVR